MTRFDWLDRLQHPNNHWVLNHWRELVPTAQVRRGPGPARALEVDPGALASFRFRSPGGAETSLDTLFETTDTDGLLILRRGRIAYERYRGELSPDSVHRCFSVTKSFVGLLCAMLIHDGTLDANRLVSDYVPELRWSGWHGATLRQVMDMTTAIRFNEDYEDRNSDVIPSRIATGSYPRPDGYRGPDNIDDYLPTLGIEGRHGEAFKYVTPNTEVLGWVLRRVTGLPVPQLLSARLWQPLGAEEDACLALDAKATAACGGGLCTTLRDLARFAELIRNRGRIGDRQVVATEVIEDICRGGDPAAFARAGWALFDGWSYRSQWWISHDAFGSIRALGVHGQQIYVSMRAGIAAARFSAQRLAVDEAIEQQYMAAFAALCST